MGEGGCCITVDASLIFTAAKLKNDEVKNPAMKKASWLDHLIER